MGGLPSLDGWIRPVALSLVRHVTFVFVAAIRTGFCALWPEDIVVDDFKMMLN